MHASVDPHSAKIIKCNETLCEKLGYTKDELVGSEIFMAYDSTCHLDVQRAFDKFQRTGQVKNVELVLKTKQGKKIDVILNVSSVKNEDGEILYSRSSWTDITKLKRVEKERITYARRLEAQNKELEQFVFIASHDLQEPLRTVTSFTDLLANDYKDSFDETGQKSLKFIVEATGRMRILVKGLLDYSRIGKDSEIQAINISILISEIEQDLGAKIASTGAKIKTGKLPREVMSYGTDLRQLFQNLIVNAIKFRKEGVHPVVEISHIDKKNMHQFSIADNGIGIAKEHHGKVFKIFKRLNNRTNYDGTGIGLAHCQKIVDLHGGKIWVESVFGEGSTFYFTVPKHKKG
jgi:PAS domain S-box-containing protein